MARTQSVFTASRKSRLEGLQALRDRLAKSIDNPELANKDLAPLASRHSSVLAEIAAIQAEETAKTTVVEKPKTARDEIAEKRAARIAARKAS